jgi:hypothetical protein
MRLLSALGYFALFILLTRAVPVRQSDSTLSNTRPHVLTGKTRRGAGTCDPNKFWPEQSDDTIGDILDTEKYFGE